MILKKKLPQQNYNFIKVNYIDQIIIKLKKNKIAKYFLIGGFLFFFLKGLAWLVIIFLAFNGINNLF